MSMPRLILAFTCAVIACLGVGSLLNAATLFPAHMAIPSAIGLRFVATSGSDTSDCTDSANPCATLQHALNMATSGDEIRMAAGLYTQTQAYKNTVEVGVILTSVVLRGGFTTTNWVTPDRQTNHTTLDAQRKGQVLVVGVGNFNVTIDGLYITGGRGGPGGGVFALRSGSITLTNNVIVDNTAAEGGGVFLQESHVTLIGNSVLGNTATGFGTSGGIGGGVMLPGNESVYMSGNIVSGNQALNGMSGGIYMCGFPMTVTNNLIMHNVAGTYGGLSYCENAAFGPVTITGNTFMGNHADGFCGGLCLNANPGSTLYVYGNLMTDNDARLGGGGLYILSSSPLLVNNVVRSNRSDMGGSGIQVDGASPRLIHTTVNQNSGGDGAFVIGNNWQGFSSNVSMTNTIVANSTTGIVVSTTSSATVNGTLWYGNAVNVAGAGLVTVTNAYVGNPAFAADGYHLTRGSKAIDVGVPTPVDQDIDGEPRPYGAGADMGADEYVGPPLTHTYLPFIIR